jgi:hypothetical protein
MQRWWDAEWCCFRVWLYISSMLLRVSRISACNIHAHGFQYHHKTIWDCLHWIKQWCHITWPAKAWLGPIHCWKFLVPALVCTSPCKMYRFFLGALISGSFSIFFFLFYISCTWKSLGSDVLVFVMLADVFSYTDFVNKLHYIPFLYCFWSYGTIRWTSIYSESFICHHVVNICWSYCEHEFQTNYDWIVSFFL